MRLNNIPSPKGGTRPRKRVGRGRGSGHGKTSGRGHNGQRSRSGSSLRPGFESGHVPLFRRLPKRGFSNSKFRHRYAVINIDDLARLEGIDEIDLSHLISAGLIRRNATSVKVLGTGAIDRAVKIRAHAFSGSAVAKITEAGGEAIDAKTGLNAGPDDAADKAGDDAPGDEES